MNRIKISLFIFITTLNLFGQSNSPLAIFTVGSLLGRNIETGTEIKGLQFIFPDRIHNLHVDTLNGYLTAQLRGVSKNGKYLNSEGSVIQFDTYTRNIKWRKNINYQRASIEWANNTIIHTVGKKSFCLNNETGEKQWKTKTPVYFTSPANNIGIGYKPTYEKEFPSIEGVNLSNGKVLWKRNLKYKYGWERLSFLNDSTLLAVADGIHTINIKNGVGWSYQATTKHTDRSKAAAANAAGIALGVLTGIYIISTGYDLYWGMESNIISDSTALYYASKNTLASIDKQTGKILWTYYFSDHTTSKSHIFADNDFLYMINAGYIFKNYQTINYGTPFWAVFDKRTGEQVSLTAFYENEGVISGHILRNDTLYLLSKNNIIQCSLKSKSVLQNKLNKNTVYGELLGEVNYHAYQIDSLGVKNVTRSDTTKLYVQTSGDIILMLDKDLNEQGILYEKQLYIQYAEVNGFKFAAKDNHTYILNSADEIVAELNVSGKSFVEGNKLYSIKDQSIFEIDLSEILNGKLLSDKSLSS